MPAARFQHPVVFDSGSSTGAANRDDVMARGTNTTSACLCGGGVLYCGRVKERGIRLVVAAATAGNEQAEKQRLFRLMREVAATLALAVQTCSLHRHIADMSILIQDLASSGDDVGTIDVGSSVVHLAQALQDSAAAESQVLYPLT